MTKKNLALLWALFRRMRTAPVTLWRAGIFDRRNGTDFVVGPPLLAYEHWSQDGQDDRGLDYLVARTWYWFHQRLVMLIPGYLLILS
jgi:hypothetical protein